MGKFKHIIWDWNGTLLDDIDTCIESMNFILIKRDLEPLDRIKYLSVFDFPVKDYYIRLGLDFSKEPFETVSDEFTGQYEKSCFSCRLHKEAVSVLSDINIAGITQSILTAAHQNYIEKCVRHYGIENYFIKISGLDNTHAFGKVGNGKKLISELPYEANEVVLIGDTEHDYKVAKEMGCKCILVACGHHCEQRLKATGALVLKSLSDVLDFIK